MFTARFSVLSVLCVALAVAACGATNPASEGGGSGTDTGSGGSNTGSSGSGSNTGSSGSGSNGSGSSGSGSGTSTGNAALTFAIVGDTRPASIDDTANYPTSIITKIYQDIEAASPKPQFAIATGDYQYASTSGNEQAPQLQLYMNARSAFSGPLYPAMGNHECTGYTASNCGSGNTDGVTKNMTEFIDLMLSPIQQTKPYYVEKMQAGDGSWTAKVVVVACNAWDSTQASWLTSALSDDTTYTFVVRHESAADMQDTKCSQSQTIIGAHPLTLLIVGHTHEYHHASYDHEVIIGIGGAPLTSGTNYGYTIVSRNNDGTLTVTTYDYKSHATIDSFKIDASGASA